MSRSARRVCFFGLVTRFDVWKLRKKDPQTCSVSDLDRPQFLVAYKSAGETYVKELSAAEFDTLDRLRGGRPLGQVMAEVAVVHPDFDAAAVAGFFQVLFRAGLICSIDGVVRTGAVGDDAMETGAVRDDPSDNSTE